MKTEYQIKKDLLSNFRALVNFTSLFLALALEMVRAIAMALPMKVYVISLRLKQRTIQTTTKYNQKSLTLLEINLLGKFSLETNGY